MTIYISEASHEMGRVAKLLRERNEFPGMTLRNIAAFTGIDKSTLLRIKQQKHVDCIAFLTVRYWLEHVHPSPEQGKVTPPPSLEQGVTDEQVERACRVHNVGWSIWKEPQKKTAREVMRSAIEAALSKGAQP